MNECKEDDVGKKCEGICINYDGSYDCVCSEGYSLDEDGYRCFGEFLFCTCDRFFNRPTDCQVPCAEIKFSSGILQVWEGRNGKQDFTGGSGDWPQLFVY